MVVQIRSHYNATYHLSGMVARSLQSGQSLARVTARPETIVVVRPWQQWRVASPALRHSFDLGGEECPHRVEVGARAEETAGVKEGFKGRKLSAELGAWRIDKRLRLPIV
jgi:hypothetical protein